MIKWTHLLAGFTTLRTEPFNLFQPAYNSVLQQGASNFGIVSSQLNNPWLQQFSLRLNY
jgi:hypothetical protein